MDKISTGLGQVKDGLGQVRDTVRSYTSNLGLSPSQVWSLSSFEISCQLLTNDLNQVSSVSLLMTASMALANEGLFELTRRPSLTRAVLLSFAETT